MRRTVIGRAAVVAALALSLVLAGCTSSQGDGLDLQDPAATPIVAESSAVAAPSREADPAHSSAPSVPPGPGVVADPPEEQAVLGAYRAFWAGLAQANADPPRSQDYLAPVATGVQFEQTNSAIKADFLAGEISEGSPVLNPTVASVDGDIAVVHDCQDTRGVVGKDVETGEVLVIGMAEDSVQSTLQRVDGTWKVAATTYPEPAGVFC